VRNKLSRIFLGLLLAVSFALLYKESRLKLGDPDRYYHFALSREMVQSGKLFLRSLPQVEDLGWGEFFVDKEFLFHQVTALGYWINGDAGAEFGSTLLTIAGMLAFFAFASSKLPPVAAFAVTFFTYSCPLMMARILLLRPHVMGIFAFVLMNIAVLSKRPLATGLAVFFFTMSYHAFYVPLVCLVFLIILSFFDSKESAKEWRRVAYFGIFGCFCGLLANPYFPGNIEIAIIHAKIPGLYEGALKGLNFGAEHTPLRSDAFFEVFHAPLLVLMLAFFVLGWEQRDRGEEATRRRLQIVYMLGVAGLFFVLSFKTRRAGEYFVPAMGLLGIFLLQALRKRPVLLVAIPLGLGLLESSIFYRVFKAEYTNPDNSRYELTVPAIQAIPKEPRGAKIYNCEWDFSPYIFYLRPDLRFIDIMDPSLLYFRPDRGAFQARDDLRHGFLGDPHGMILNAAKADYVLCNEPGVNSQLRDDPGFQQIYPKVVSAGSDGRVPSLFAVRKTPVETYVRVFDVSSLGSYAAGKLPKAGSEENAATKREARLQRTSFLDLGPMLAQQLGKEKPAGDLNCALVKPQQEEIERLAGASTLVVGGGQGVEVWRNGKPLFRSLPAFTFNRSTQAVLELRPVLGKSDRIELLTCSAPTAAFWGTSLSFWKSEELKAACEWKYAGLTSIPPSQWEYQGLERSSCLGVWAAKTR